MSDTETRDKLLASAKIEFMKNGFSKSSLRTICKNAGVTTGALYFFFKDKNELFSEIVKKPFDELKEIVSAHFNEDKQFILSEEWLSSDKNNVYVKRHDDLSAEIVHHIYSYYDEFRLLLMKSQGSEYEKCAEGFVYEIEKCYRGITDGVIDKGGKVDMFLVHWFSHIIIDAFAHLIENEPDEEKAIEHIGKIMNFVIGGWIKLIFDKE